MASRNILFGADNGEAAISFVEAKYPPDIILLNSEIKYSYKELSEVDWDIYKDEDLQVVQLYYRLCENKQKCFVTLSKNNPAYFSSCMCKEK